MSAGIPVTPVEINARQRGAIRRLRSWRRFHYHKRRADSPLLESCVRYPNSVFVAGCQRSGTTMLTRLIAGSEGFRPLRLTHDDELDAALVLSGEVDLPAGARYCFQTTYLNECYAEYRRIGGEQRLLWVIRNPYSVVYSMVHNWSRFALNELYAGCCTDERRPCALALEVGWPSGPRQIEKAARAYAAKTAQIFEIRRLVDASRIMLVDYDELVIEPRPLLERVFRFVSGTFRSAHASAVRPDSVAKAAALSRAERNIIERLAEPTYRECLTLI